MGLYAALNLYLPPPALSGSGALRCYEFRVMSILGQLITYNVKLTTYNSFDGYVLSLFLCLISQNKAPLLMGKYSNYGKVKLLEKKLSMY